MASCAPPIVGMPGLVAATLQERVLSAKRAIQAAITASIPANGILADAAAATALAPSSGGVAGSGGSAGSGGGAGADNTGQCQLVGVRIGPGARSGPAVLQRLSGHGAVGIKDQRSSDGQDAWGRLVQKDAEGKLVLPERVKGVILRHGGQIDGSDLSLELGRLLLCGILPQRPHNGVNYGTGQGVRSAE